MTDKKTRLEKNEYYLDIARTVSKRATCLRRRFGAVIVVNDQVVSSGYCGAPRKTKDCLEREECLRAKMNIPSGERYELCRSVHAEQNAIINATRAGVNILGGEIYVWGFCLETKKEFSGFPCLLCLKMCVNAGMKKIYYSEPDKREKYDVLHLAGLIENWNSGDILRGKE
jgi:dCMP deaminase